MGLTKLIATLRQHLGHRRHQAGLLVAEHRQNRPLQLREGLQEGFERGVSLLREPAASPGQGTGELSNEPELRLAAFGSQAIQSDEQAAWGLSALSQTVPGLSLVAGQERQRHLLI